MYLVREFGFVTTAILRNGVCCKETSLCSHGQVLNLSKPLSSLNTEIRPDDPYCPLDAMRI